MEGFFGKKNSTNANFNGGIFHFSHGYSVSQLIASIAQQTLHRNKNFRGRERENKMEGFFEKK